METIITSDGSEVIGNHHLHTSNVDIPGTVSIVQVIPGQTIQVDGTHSIITAAALQQGLKAYQVIGSDGDNAASTDEDSESKKRRELLARRPSYRRILNELSATDHPGTITVAKIEEESDENSSDTEDGMAHIGGLPLQAASLLQQASLKVLPAQTIQIAAHGDGTAQGLQTLTMTNASGSSVSPAPGGATLVQYAQAADGQFLIPVSTIGGGGIQYQIAGTAGTLPQGVVMATAGGQLTTGHQVGEEQSRKRELRLLKNRQVDANRPLRLLKNREAARECRRKKKEYVKCLENRVAVLENQNKTLIEELKSLKELYCQKESQS